MAESLRAWGDDAGVGGVDALNVRIYLAALGLEDRGEGDGGGVGAAAAEGRNVEGLGEALEAGDDHDAARIQLPLEALGLDAGDEGLAVGGFSLDAGLDAGDADGGEAHVVEGHGHEGAGDHLAGGEEGVHLALVGAGGHLVGKGDEVVGGVAHGGADGEDLVALGAGPGDAGCHVLDVGGAGQGAAAVLLDDEGHARYRSIMPCLSPRPGHGGRRVWRRPRGPALN